MTVLLCSVALQRQVLYKCNSDNTVHLSCCCDETDNAEACCKIDNQAPGEQFKETCCSQSDVSFSANFKNLEDFRVKCGTDLSDAFYLSMTESTDIVLNKELSVNSLFNNSPPRYSKQIYISLCTFLC